MVKLDNATKLTNKLLELGDSINTIESITYKDLCNLLNLTYDTNVKAKERNLSLLEKFFFITKDDKSVKRLNLVKKTNLTSNLDLVNASNYLSSNFSSLPTEVNFPTYESLANFLQVKPSYDEVRKEHLSILNRFYSYKFDVFGYTLTKKEQVKDMRERLSDDLTKDYIIKILTEAVEEAEILGFFNQTEELYYYFEVTREGLISYLNLVSELYLDQTAFEAKFNYLNRAYLNHFKELIEQVLSDILRNVINRINKLGLAEVYSTYKVTYVNNNQSVLASAELFTLIENCRGEIASTMELSSRLSIDKQIITRGLSEDFYLTLLKHPKLLELSIINIQRVRVFKFSIGLQPQLVKLKQELLLIDPNSGIVKVRKKLKDQFQHRVNRDQVKLHEILLTSTEPVTLIIKENYLLSCFTDDYLTSMETLLNLTLR